MAKEADPFSGLGVVLAEFARAREVLRDAERELKHYVERHIAPEAAKCQTPEQCGELIVRLGREYPFRTKSIDALRMVNRPVYRRMAELDGDEEYDDLDYSR